MSAIKDFHAWCFDQAELIRQGNYTQLDRENLIEEIESLGRQERDKLTSALRILFMHLLKYIYQPEYRSKSWLYSIAEERRQIKKFMSNTPSLKSSFDECVEEAYEKARYQAARETGIDLETFNEEYAFDIDDALKEGWLP